ncbi:hypothetical protein Tco_0697477 [Tanacetum coccineum]
MSNIFDEDEKGDQGDQADLTNNQRNRMPRIKADIPTFSVSLNIEDFLDWVGKYFELMDIPKDSQVKYVAYKLRGTASSWWDNLQTVASFNNGLRYDIQAIISLQTSWTLDEAVRMALKAELTISHTSNQCRVKAVNVAERGEWYEDESENEECFIPPEDVLDEEEDDEHGAYSYVVHVVNVIIDGESSENIISQDIVSRLKLAPRKHPTPYKIDWIKATWMRVMSYLGDLGKFDLGVIHKGKENTSTFLKDGKKFTLCPFSSKDRSKADKEKASTILLCSREAFLAEVRHDQSIFAVVVKGDNKIIENVPPKLHDLLSEFKNIMPEELPDGLPRL